MSQKPKISLNFSPLKELAFTFLIFRKKREANDKKPKDKSIFGGRLPFNETKENYQNFWVSFTEFEGSEQYICKQDININLTKSFLLQELKNSAETRLKKEDFEIQVYTKYKRIYFIIQNHIEGKEMVWIEPYYLEENNEFGFLIDYKFSKSESVAFNRKVQVLSLSLNSIGRSNTAFYSDKYLKIRNFAQKFYKIIFEGTILDFAPPVELPYNLLVKKTFIIKNNQEINAQTKMRGIGPFQTLFNPINIYFLHRESERQIISTFHKELKFELETTYNVLVEFHGHRCEEINNSEIESLSERIKTENYSNPLVIVLKKDPIEENDLYYLVKYIFSANNIPVQFINYDTLKNKYSIRDFSLQIFSKAGGVPWIVKTLTETTLIIGLAQSIRFANLNGERTQQRYYAYSILIESTGLYNSIEVISSNKSKEVYLSELRKKLSDILEKKSSKYSRIAIHAPFKITYDELEQIKKIIEIKNPNIEFVVLRINLENKYFGYNKEINNLTPIEGTCVKFGKGKYLIWAEGISELDFKPKKRYSGPIFVEFMFQNNDKVDQLSYLQELFSLSGMNWRAYNSKSTPISVQYCDLVTDFVSEFRERKYSELEANNLRPWFL